MPSVDIDGVRVNYTDTGSGVAVVFVPGPCGAKEWFCYQSAGLADHYRVICCDLRRTRGECSLPLLVADIDRLLTKLRLPDAVIVGHSLGGLAALLFAVTHPDRCLAVVTSSTAPTYADVPDDELNQDLVLCQPESEDSWSRLRRWWTGFVIRLSGKAKAAPNPANLGQGVSDPPDPLEHLSRNNGGIDCSDLSARLALMRHTDLRPVLDDIEVPALIVAGSGERPYILAGAQTMDEAIPDCSVEIIEGTDQYHFYLRHDLFNAVLVDFLMRKVARL